VAGSTLASRLSESGDNKVLVLEAGPARINDPLIGGCSVLNSNES
jgi:choline dehydrogenase-like flavoprotein